jgi:hypothetical protein
VYLQPKEEVMAVGVIFVSMIVGFSAAFVSFLSGATMLAVLTAYVALGMVTALLLAINLAQLSRRGTEYDDQDRARAGT